MIYVRQIQVRDRKMDQKRQVRDRKMDQKRFRIHYGEMVPQHNDVSG
jgi:hypothetical protein